MNYFESADPRGPREFFDDFDEADYIEMYWSES